MNTRDEYISSILNLSKGDLGRYFLLCHKYNNLNSNKLPKKEDMLNITKSSKNKCIELRKTLIENKIIDISDNNEIILKFNILKEMGIKLNPKKFNINIEHRSGATLLGRVLFLFIIREKENKSMILKAYLRKVLNYNKDTFSALIKSIKDIEYDGIKCFDTKENVKYIKVNTLYNNSKIIENCVYRFIDKKGKVLYVGSCKNLFNRMSSHFNIKTSHLPLELYKNINKIEYHSFYERSADMSVYEVYYINKYQPKYNKKDKGIGLSIHLPELEWREYDRNLIIQFQSENTIKQGE